MCLSTRRFHTVRTSLNRYDEGPTYDASTVPVFVPPPSSNPAGGDAVEEDAGLYEEPIRDDLHAEDANVYEEVEDAPPPPPPRPSRGELLEEAPPAPPPRPSRSTNGPPSSG